MTATAPPLAEVVHSEAALRAFLHGLPGVDQVGVEQRAATLATRSIKTTAKAWAIDLAIRMVDLTTLEGADTLGKVRAMCAKARRPDPTDPSCPSVAAACIYPSLVATAADALKGSGVHLASVATAFPSGQASLTVKLGEVTEAIAAGADEIDMVINRGAFLAGRYQQVYEEIAAVKQACGEARRLHSDPAERSGPGQRRGEARRLHSDPAERSDPGQRRGEAAHLKVILETGELVTYDNVRRASWLAMLAGADFVKTSTGKVQPAATLPVTLVMLEAVRDFAAAAGRRVGVKPAGGIRSTKDALRYLVVVNETAGEEWLDPDWFRFGASTLLNDLLMQRRKLATGHYDGPDYVTLD